MMQTHASFLLVVTNPQRVFERITATTITETDIMRIATTTSPPTIATILVVSEVAVVGGVMSVPGQREISYVHGDMES